MHETTLTTLIVVAGVLVAVSLTIGLLVPYLKKRGVDLDKIIKQTNEAISAAAKIYELGSPFLQDVPGVQKVDALIKIAHEATAHAEELMHLGSIEPGARASAASDYVMKALKVAGIEPSPEVMAVVEGAKNAGIFALGHKP